VGVGLARHWPPGQRALGWSGRAFVRGGHGDGRLPVRLQRNVSLSPVDETKHGGHAAQIADFVRCLRSGETPETVCTDNLWSLAMVFGAIESATTGRTVPVRAL